MIVYLLVNKANGKVYVGQTSKTLHLRWQLHKADARFGRQLRICRAIRKHGDASFELYEIGAELDASSADNLVV